MNKFVKAWKGSLPKYQANIIDQFVKDKQAAGELQGKEEYTKFYRSLVDKLQKKFGKPLFEPVSTQFDEVADSNTHNYSIMSVRGDVNALYRELDAVYSATMSHREHIEKNIIPSFEGQAEDIQNLLLTYELLAGNTQGYNHVQVNDFKNSNARRKRSEPDAPELFSDTRKNTVLGADHDCRIAENAGVLIMPVNPSTTNTVKIKDIILEENGSIFGNFVSNYGVGPENILSGGHWRLDNYFFWKPNTEVVVALTATFPSISKINKLSFTPLNDIAPMQITQIEMVDVSGVRTTLDPINTAALNSPLNTTTSFFFQTFYAKAVTFYLKQSSPSVSQMNGSQQQEQKGTTFGFSQQKNSNKNIYAAGAKAKVMGYSKPGLTGEASFKVEGGGKTANKFFKLTNKIGGNAKQDTVPTHLVPLYPTLPMSTLPPGSVDSYMYSFGCAGMQASFENYFDSGIYVSKKSDVSLLSGLALETAVSVPDTYLYPIERSYDMEWQVVKFDYDSEETLIGSDRFSVLPFRTTYVSKERIFPDGDGLAKLRFPATVDLGLGITTFNHDIKVFKNGMELTEDSEWQLETSKSDDYATLISLLGSAAPTYEAGYEDIYTVSYTPGFLYPEHGTNLTDIGWTSRKLFNEDGVMKKFYINNSGTLWYTQYNTIEHEPKPVNYTAQTSEVFLVLIMRGLTFDTTITPILDSYRLMLGGLSVA